VTESSRRNLAEVVARVKDPERAKAGLAADRKYHADLIRAAKIRVAANKAANGGIYVA
jgi:hypothetical protein